MPKWAEAEKGMIHEIIREAEARLHGQVQLATSADQRAAVLAGVFIAAGTAIIAALLAGIASHPSLAIILGAITAAALFLAGAGYCIRTVMPCDFHLPGNQPDNWYSDVDERRALKECLGQAAEHCQDAIVENRKQLQANARLFARGAWLGVSAPVAGALVWLLLSARWDFGG